MIWLQAFLNGTSGSLTRQFRLDAFLNKGRPVTLVLDASPWGLGGLLLEERSPVEWFTSALTPFDENLFQVPIGSPDGQQIWESLAALVALRIWKHRWTQGRILLEVSGDSVAMLTLVLRMRARSGSPGLGIVAREIAFDVAEAVYTPDLATHIPGIANVAADMLSRRFAPQKGTKIWTIPEWLLSVPERTAPIRNTAYFRALHFPTASARHEGT